MGLEEVLMGIKRMVHLRERRILCTLVPPLTCNLSMEWEGWLLQVLEGLELPPDKDN